MIKTFLIIAISGMFTAPVGARTTFVNAGTTSVVLVDESTKKALESLSEQERTVVNKALHSVKPGESIKLAAGKYHVDLGEGIGNKAVVCVEQKKPEESQQQKPEESQQTGPKPSTDIPPAPTQNESVGSEKPEETQQQKPEEATGQTGENQP